MILSLEVHLKISVYRSVRVLIKEIIRKIGNRKAEERVLHHEDI